ncbi:MAG: YjbH domain-containing protein [Bacteroidaceae bacterium]|nr:YjbH domain-containing protein [Bacteroidaceae bacterium]
MSLAKHIILLALTLCTVSASGQSYHGTTGLLHVPSAEMDSAGTFRGGGMFLDKRFTPAQLNRNGEKYNTFTYFIGVSMFRWVEISYAAALLYYTHKKDDSTSAPGYYNEDRRMNVKVNPLYEGRWWPAIALGMDDIGRFKRIKTGVNGNNYFQNIYAVATKHFNIHGHVLGAHVGYRYYPSDVNSDRRGVAGGISYTPWLGEKLQGDPRAWIQRPRVVVEWDGAGVNVGMDALLWRHLFVQAMLVHGQGFTGGLSYHYRMKY